MTAERYTILLDFIKSNEHMNGILNDLFVDTSTLAGEILSASDHVVDKIDDEEFKRTVSLEDFDYVFFMEVITKLYSSMKEFEQIRES